MCTFAQLSISPSTCLRNCVLSLDPDGKNKDKAERDIEKNKDRLCESPIEKGMGMLLSFSSISDETSVPTARIGVGPNSLSLCHQAKGLRVWGSVHVHVDFCEAFDTHVCQHSTPAGA